MFTKRNRRIIIAVLAMVAAAVLLTSSAGAAHPAKARQHHAAIRTLSSQTSYNVSFRLQGCDLASTTTLPISGKFICPDADYSDGNLGKNWNELDLVPHRILITAGTNAPATQTYTFQIAADYSQTTNGNPPVTEPGYDVIENGFENVSSTAANNQQPAGTCSASIGAQHVSGTVPANQTIWRPITVTQTANSVCQLDLWLRLAVGAHLFPGSSLHSYLFNDGGDSLGDSSGIGEKTNSIPTNEIAPQSISKDMLAQRDTDHTWNVTKSATPASLDFGNICSTDTFPRTQGVSVTVTWTKGAATPSGQTSITTNIYANNPSHRVIDVGVTDDIYAGTTQTTLIDSHTFDAVAVPADTNHYLVATHTVSTSDTSTHFNDVATATYTDDVAQVPVPGTTTATAGADVAVGNELNASATITDSESITTGKNLSFKVTSPTTGYTDPDGAGPLTTYVSPNYTTGPVTWSSGSQSDSGSQVFAKTVKMDPGILLGTGDAALTDQATINGSDGFSASSDLLSVGITSSRVTSLTIDKTVPTGTLTGTESVTFHFTVKDSQGDVVATPSITFNAGDNEKTVNVPNLDGDVYTVSEDAPTGTSSTGWTLASNQNVDLTSSCSGTANMANTVASATLTANKVTDPTTNAADSSSYESGWTFTLTKPDGTTVSGTTDSTGQVQWSGGGSSMGLDAQGTYNVAETTQAGWDRTNTDAGTNGTVTTGGACQFVVNYPANAGASYNCTITNKSRYSIKVIKTVNGAALTGSQSFQFEVVQGASTSTIGTVVGGPTTVNASNNTATFTGLKPGVQYALCEMLVAGFGPAWPTGYGPYNPTDAPNWECIDFVFQPSDIAANTNGTYLNGLAHTFNVDNTHATAGALTIGYWKNHAASDCKKSKGHQADVLSQYLGGITLGTITFNSGTSYWECQAIQTLSKNTFGGVNKASDPLFNMAAQLLAYYLNLNSGTATCQAAAAAASSGQTLLSNYGWNGTTYNGPLSAADAQTANSDASLLDQFNNNNLC